MIYNLDAISTPACLSYFFRCLLNLNSNWPWGLKQLLFEWLCLPQQCIKTSILLQTLWGSSRFLVIQLYIFDFCFLFISFKIVSKSKKSNSIGNKVNLLQLFSKFKKKGVSQLLNTFASNCHPFFVQDFPTISQEPQNNQPILRSSCGGSNDLSFNATRSGFRPLCSHTCHRRRSALQLRSLESSNENSAS